MSFGGLKSCFAFFARHTPPFACARGPAGVKAGGEQEHGGGGRLETAVHPAVRAGEGRGGFCFVRGRRSKRRGHVSDGEEIPGSRERVAHAGAVAYVGGRGAS